MKKLIAILFCALCLAAHADNSLYEEVQGNGVYQTADYQAAERIAGGIKARWLRGGLRAIAEDNDKALDGIMRIAIRNLRFRGFRQEAYDMEMGWARHKGVATELLNASLERRITDYDPISKFLAVSYYILEEKLGYDICRALHLDLILTFNFTLKYIFSEACNHDEQEFFYHFVHDDPTVFHPYKGAAPGTAYVISALSCNIATFGAGIFWLCGPLAGLIEMSFDRAIGPALSPKVFGMLCRGEK